MLAILTTRILTCLLYTSAAGSPARHRQGAMDLRHRVSGSLHQRPQETAEPAAGPQYAGIQPVSYTHLAQTAERAAYQERRARGVYLRPLEEAVRRKEKPSRATCGLVEC